MSHNQRVAQFMGRLLIEFPEWTNTQALDAAERIIAHGEQMQFQMDVEADLAALPMTTEPTEAT